MHVIPAPLSETPTSEEPGLRALAADLRAPEDPGARDDRRRAVVARLEAAGLGPDLLEALLPGWGRYREDEVTGVRAVAE